MLISAIIFYSVLMAIVVLLFLMWRLSVKRTGATLTAMLDLTTKSSEQATISASAAKEALEVIRKLVMERKPDV